MNEQGVTTEAEQGEQPASKRRLPLLLIPLLIVTLLLAAFVGTNVLGVLFGVLAPPLPPLPPAMTQVDHSSADYGVDDWTYTSATDACEVAAYFQEHDGICMYAPLQCGEYRETDGTFEVNNTDVARCSGQVPFSIFNMQWSVMITRPQDATTQINLHREVYWIGTGPQ